MLTSSIFAHIINEQCVYKETLITIQHHKILSANFRVVKRCFVEQVVVVSSTIRCHRQCVLLSLSSTSWLLWLTPYTTHTLLSFNSIYKLMWFLLNKNISRIVICVNCWLHFNGESHLLAWCTQKSDDFRRRRHITGR